MNQKELNEIRRRFRVDSNAIGRVYGCYVNSNKSIISRIDTSMGLLSKEEQEMYLKLLKRSLQGALGRNLIDIEFSIKQVEDSPEHRLLQTLRSTALADEAAREELCRRIIDSLDMGDSNYLILMAADAYDVPFRGKDDTVLEDASETVHEYFVCSVCPVRDPKLALMYDLKDSWFHSASTGHVALAPEFGFMFPAFDGRTSNIYNALFYDKSLEEGHRDVIDAVFKVKPPMPAGEQKNVFGTALSDALDRECSYDIVQAVHEQIRSRIEEHKESKDPEPLTMSFYEVGNVLTANGVSADKVEAFQDECRTRYGAAAELNPANIIDSSKFQITTPDVKVEVSPDASAIIETRVIDGKAYILIPASGNVEINGIEVSIPQE